MSAFRPRRPNIAAVLNSIYELRFLSLSEDVDVALIKGRLGEAPHGRQRRRQEQSMIRHHGWGEPLFRLEKQRLSQISSRRVFRVIRHFVLSLSRQCFGALLGDRFRRNTQDQRWPLLRPFHSLRALFLFWLRKKAKVVKRKPTCRGPRARC